MCNSNDNDLEDGEIPSDEDDEPVSRAPSDVQLETVKSAPKPPEPAKNKTFDPKFSKNKKQQPMQAANKQDRFLKYKGPTEDWAGDVEKAIKAAMEEDGSRSKEITKPKNKNNRNKMRKRAREEKDEDRIKEQKVRNVRISSDFITVHR